MKSETENWTPPLLSVESHWMSTLAVSSIQVCNECVIKHRLALGIRMQFKWYQRLCIIYRCMCLCGLILLCLWNSCHWHDDSMESDELTKHWCSNFKPQYIYRLLSIQFNVTCKGIQLNGSIQLNIVCISTHKFCHRLDEITGFYVDSIKHQVFLFVPLPLPFVITFIDFPIGFICYHYGRSCAKHFIKSNDANDQQKMNASTYQWLSLFSCKTWKIVTSQRHLCTVQKKISDR